MRKLSNMPFVKFNAKEEITRQCAANPEFKRIYEEKHGLGIERYDLDELEELMTEFPDCPLLKNLALDEEATKRLLKAMEDTSKTVYEKNDRLQEGKELLEKLSAQYNAKS